MHTFVVPLQSSCKKKIDTQSSSIKNEEFIVERCGVQITMKYCERVKQYCLIYLAISFTEKTGLEYNCVK